MIWILCFSLFYFALTSLVLIRNHYEFKALNDIKIENSSEKNPPLVSVCIPARNEEETIERCVTSALKQDYPNFEVLVLDDHSTDGTTAILEELSGIIHNLKHLKGAEKPDEWLGKPWACHQLSRQAKGEILVFIDADVWLEPDVLQKTVSKLQSKDALTVWPEQKLGSFWEQMIVPLVYHTLFTLLPAIYVERPPRWMPASLQQKMSRKFAAACGQFFAFKRTSYDSIEGHTSVKHHVVEDVQLARNLKEKDLQLQMYHGQSSVYCRMYNNHSEIWNGFKKNFLSGFNNLAEFFFMWLVHIVVYFLPVYIGIKAWINDEQILCYLSVITFLIPTLQRFYLAIKFRWNLITPVLHVVSVLWFQVLAFISVLNKLTGVRNTWKGREV